MTTWKDRIINAFIGRYPKSAAAKLVNDDCSAENRVLRIPAVKIFSDFDKASPDEKDSFLEAAESLERQQLLSLVWVRHRKGEMLASLVCPDMEKLYKLTERPSPKTAAEAARAAAREAAGQLINNDDDPNTEKAGSAINSPRAFFLFLAETISASDADKGITAESIRDLALLFKTLSKPVNLTIRALSISLYNDSKRLEALINSYKTIFARAERQGILISEFSFLDRSFPETSIAGPISITIENAQALINESGSILTLPLITIQKIKSIIPGKFHSVLMIENKETFFTLAASPHKYTCLLYVGGHPNRAVRALVTILAKSGFAFYHTGDLDPDGILILQELQGIVYNASIVNNANIAGQTVTPVYMDASTFERYLKHGRKLEPSMLKRIKLIKDETRILPGIAELIKKIETTGKGIEQEIIEYREGISL
ncbi:hypothetical protein FACS189485_06180 [Spirochaetia bacterium]|nr:hypothetical protein FACS189485_06180 [Spirochaetia bacterium]